MNVQPQLHTFHQLVSGRLFRIPQYQRAYSWGTKQRRDLFEDINRTFERPGSTHFMATVVGLRREPRIILATEFQVIDVVDGQQRLTTLVILLKAIEKALNGATDPTEIAIAQELRSTLVKADEVAPVLLQTNHDSSSYCLNYLRGGHRPDVSVARTIADRELLKAFEECESFVANWLLIGRTMLDLVTLIRNRLYFILYEITDESLVYSVFEVLNSRGLDVSWFDRLKSALMGIAFDAETGNAAETIDELHNIWRDIYDCVGLRQGIGTEALRFAGTLKATAQTSRPLAEEEAVSVLRAATRGTVKGVIDISQWMLRVAKAVDALQSNRRREGVTGIVQARLLAVSILLRDDFSEPDRHAAMENWERVSFRIFGMFRKDSRTKVGEYVRLAWYCWNEEASPAFLNQELEGLAYEYGIDDAVDELRNSDCYSEWKEELRYLLFRYEEHLAARSGQKFDNEQWNRIWADTATRSIEHIFPQSAALDDATDHGAFVHRLGNLVLLPPGLNSALGMKPPIEKKDAYFKTGLLIAQDVANRIPEWDIAAIEAREEEMLKWVRQEWANPSERGSII